MHRSKATPNIKEEKAPMMKGNASHTNSAHHTHSEEGTGVGIISKGNVQQNSVYHIETLRTTYIGVNHHCLSGIRCMNIKMSRTN